MSCRCVNGPGTEWGNRPICPSRSGEAVRLMKVSGVERELRKLVTRVEPNNVARHEHDADHGADDVPDRFHATGIGRPSRPSCTSFGYSQVGGR